MAATSSMMIPLGAPAPDFTLPDVVSGRNVSLGDAAAPVATVIMFICNHCPYVKHVQQGLVELANDYSAKGVAFLAIGSNDVERYPEDSPENMRREAARLGYPFAYLYDESQDVARAYGAACTPDFYIFDGDLRLAYRGQMDDSRPSNGIPVSGRDLRAALDALIAGQPVSADQRPGIGCGIKWKTR